MSNFINFLEYEDGEFNNSFCYAGDPVISYNSKGELVLELRDSLKLIMNIDKEISDIIINFCQNELVKKNRMELD